MTTGEACPEEQRLQHTLDFKRPALELVAHKPDATSWLASSTTSEKGTEKLYELLESHVAHPDFVEELTRQRDLALGEEAAAAAAPSSASVSGAGNEVLSQDWWEAEGRLTDVQEVTGDYIVVEREDVVQALAEFIAAYVMSLPDAQKLEPKEVQKAVAATFRELRKGKVRRLLDWGRYLYRAAALSYGAFSAFSNPYIAQCVLVAIWSFVKMVGRAGGGL